MTEIVQQERKGLAKIQLVLRFIVSASLMTWLIYMIQWDKALQLIKEGSPLFFVAAFIAIQLTVISSVRKWQLLVHSSMEKKHRQPASLANLSRYYYIGLFFNNFLPGSVGGDVMRIVYLGKHVGMSPATASVAFERLTSGAALTAIVLVSTLFMESVRPFMLPIYLVSGLLIALFSLLAFWMKKQTEGNNPTKTLGLETTTTQSKIASLMSKLKKSTLKLAETAGNYRSESWMWWGVITILSLLFQVGMAWINQLLFLGFGVEVALIDLLVIISLISFITMLPLSLNGIGIREASYVFFFQELGIPVEIAVSVSLLFFILVTISSLAGGVFWLSERGRKVEVIRQ